MPPLNAPDDYPGHGQPGQPADDFEILEEINHFPHWLHFPMPPPAYDHFDAQRVVRAEAEQAVGELIADLLDMRVYNLQVQVTTSKS